MKRLVFEEIMILSHGEKKAIKIKFNPKRTVIKGNNQVGKSSLMKSIYYTLGASPSVINKNWLNAEPITFLKMKIDDVQVSVLRFDKKRFIIVDEKKTVIPVDFKGLSSYLNELFDFNIILPNRKGEADNPPPTYLFLPFYVDQDKGWNDNWNAFSGLGQFKNWKKPLLDYHSGIKGNKYYKTKSEIEKVKIELEETKIEIDTLNKILRNIKEKLKNEEFDVSIEDFSNEISELLTECEALKSEQNKLKKHLTELYDQKSIIVSRISIVEKAIKEVQSDYKYALNYIDDEIDCPMCGAHYENNFNERFSLAEDDEKLTELLQELRIELIKVNDKIAEYDKSFIERKKDFEQIQELLSERKNQVKLIDIIENEGKKRVKEIFQNEQTEIYSKIGKAKTKFDTLEKAIKQINKDSESRKQNIMTLYRSKLNSFFKSLNLDIEKISTTIFERTDAKINEQGSSLPRALLAYYFAFWEVMDRYSTSTFCPIIIDSPNQQEQDKENLEAIMNFIIKNQPNNSQLILSLVDDLNDTFDKDTIVLEDDKYSLLKKAHYDDVYEELKPIIDKGIFDEGQFPF
ncbi:hypothetical protein R5N98_06855 [Tenacibaculum maritimum]|uniref:hypothetical protein n=1 Tax=Tenacibaculum maritimum TaxID=107401 RepID=UPI0038763976